MSESHDHFDCAVCGLTNKDFTYYGIGECNHPICGICAIKLAKFSKDIENVYDYSKCVICKHNMTKIVISSNIKSFDLFNERDMISLEQYGLLFDGISAQSFYRGVVKINCQKCSYKFDSIKDLVDHVEVHKMRYCSLCVQFNKCLPSEFDLMTDNDFHYHNTKEHPKCTFCNKRYYDGAQLIKHAKECHFLCDICNRRQGFVAYSTQGELLKHFLNDHFVCEICQSVGNINAFDSEYNLKTHKVLEHDKKSLITEGLVNVSYGDTGSRYGPRRRGRDVDDTMFDDVPVAQNQQLPEMECVQEFPPLNADNSPQNKQLGVKSVSNDENDARSAFVRKNDQHEETKKQPIVKNKENISANAAYSMKKSIGKLNENDFPSLSFDIRPSNSQGLEYKKVKNIQSNNESPVSKNKPNKEADFPALSSKISKTVPAAPTWEKTKATPKPSTYVRAPIQSVSRVREPSPEEIVDMEIEREMAYKPKIQVMKREEFEQNNNKNTVYRQCPVPQEGDFPVLGNVKGTSATTTTTMSGAWGQYNVSTHKPKSKESKFSVPDHFTPDNPLDFPELPFKQKPADNLSTNTKQKNKSKKKDNFAGAAASLNGIQPPKSKVYSLKGISEQFQKEVSVKADPVSYSDNNNTTYTQRHSSSIRGLDYVPYVVPTNENVVFVDSKQFADLKNPKQKETKDESLSLKNYENNFPSVGDLCPAAPVNNHYGVLRDTTEFEADQKSSIKIETKKVPKLSSAAEFPSLGSRKSTVDSGDKQANKGKSKKDEVKKSSVVEVVTSMPAMSLADVALSVTNKNYTAFTDTDDRNQALFGMVYGILDEELSPKFLSLSGSYRNRKITVQNYLDSINDIFVDHLAFIAELLPQMLVLLPDISLQKCLFTHMPKEWTVGLKECLKCGQILNKIDTDAHNNVAHF